MVCGNPGELKRSLGFERLRPLIVAIFSSSLVMMMVALFFCVEGFWDDIYGELDKDQRLRD